MTPPSGPPGGRDFLADDLGLQEKTQIVAPAGLGVRAAQVESAERMGAHQRAGALPVDVEIAGVEFRLGPVDPRLAVKRPG